MAVTNEDVTMGIPKPAQYYTVTIAQQGFSKLGEAVYFMRLQQKHMIVNISIRTEGMMAYPKLSIPLVGLSG